MNIVGILVQVLPAQIDAVSKKVVALGAEIHASTAQGKLVLTLEHENEAIIADTIHAFQDITGVLSATMVYHQIDNTEFT